MPNAAPRCGGTILLGALAIFAVPQLCRAQGVITTIAGTGTAGFSGDDGPATSARLNAPNGIALDGSGNIYIADYSNNRIRKIDPSGTIKTVASCGTISATCSVPLNLGDGGPATTPLVLGEWDVVADKAGNIYFPDNGASRIRKVTPAGIISTFAGSGPPGSSSSGFAGDGGLAINAKLNNPVGMAIDDAGNIYFADLNNERVRKIDTNGIITTIAGSGTQGFSGDGGLATGARLHSPHGVGVDAAGNIYIADTTNYRIRKVNTLGVISTVAGNGDTFSLTGNGDGKAATSAIIVPWDVKPDANGNLYISDWFNNRIRKVDTNGIITTVAGNGTAGFSGDGTVGTNAMVSAPTGLKVDSAGNVYFADSLNHRVRKINAPPPGPPTIRTTNTLVPSFLGAAGFSSNMYVEIYGSNFSNISRLWGGADFNGPNAPTSLDGVSVRINGKPAYIYYISPGQININVPEDAQTGPGASIQVITPQGTSNTMNVSRARLSPTLQSVPQFNVGGKNYVVALTPDFVSYIGPPGLIAGVSFVAPRPGDSVSIYALGAGPTNPPTQAGVVAAQNSALALPYQVKIGGAVANVTFAGLLANTIGLYQLNVVIPQVAAGDQPIEFFVDGVPNNQNLVITVGR